MSELSEVLVIGLGPTIIGQVVGSIHLVDDLADAFHLVEGSKRS